MIQKEGDNIPIGYAAKGWSTPDGGKTFFKNADFSLDPDCAASSADKKSCTACSLFSGKLLDGNKCITPSVPITFSNIPTDYTLVFCDTLPAGACLKCAKDKRSCLACNKKVTSPTCNGDALGNNVIY
jgi:hypothetical protein